MNTSVKTHYDLLIDENNDPLCDPEPLRSYMDTWDGVQFTDALQLSKSKSALEIGIGTGRLAIKVLPYCKSLTGIDVSDKTIERAESHLEKSNKLNLICGNYLSYDFSSKFDIIYSSLTWLHFEDKQAVMDKTAGLLNENGRFVLSIDKDQSGKIDFGTRTLKTYPDNPDSIRENIRISGLTLIQTIETENAFIFVCDK